MLLSGAIYELNKIGPRIEPWGTPCFNGTLSEIAELILTACEWSDR